MWLSPHENVHPTIFFTKRLLRTLNRVEKLSLYCDFHGHSRKYNSFIYGCHDPKKPYASREFPYIMERVCKYFKFKDCNF